jgi:hypothetical protein
MTCAVVLYEVHTAFQYESITVGGLINLINAI